MVNQYGEGGSYTVRMEGPFGSTATPIKITEITVPVATWKGGTSPFSQTVDVFGVTANSKIDLQLGYDQMELFRDQEIAFVAENTGGEVTVYAIGEKPKADVKLQATIEEVVVEGGTRIRGSAATTTVPRPDYAQTNPEKGDYIANRPESAIEKAQNTANIAKDIAEAALARSGGKMTGNIDMGSKKIENLAVPENDGDAANKKYVEDLVASKHLSKTVTATTAGWTGEGPYTQSIAVEGVTKDDIPHIGLIASDNADTVENEEEAFSYIKKVETGDGTLILTCRDDKPEVDMTILLEVNR